MNGNNSVCLVAMHQTGALPVLSRTAQGYAFGDSLSGYQNTGLLCFMNYSLFHSVSLDKSYRFLARASPYTAHQKVL